MKLTFIIAITASSIIASNSPGLIISKDDTSVEFWNPQNPQQRQTLNGLLNVAQVVPIGLRLAFLMKDGTFAISRQELLDFKPIEKYNLHKIHLLDGPI